MNKISEFAIYAGALLGATALGEGFLQLTSTLTLAQGLIPSLVMAGGAGVAATWAILHSRRPILG